MWTPCFSFTADIGKPEFKLEVSEDQRKTTLYVTDPLTALFKDGRQLNIRDVFNDQLMYRVTYRRSGSTGKVSDSRCHNIIARDEDHTNNVFLPVLSAENTGL